MYNIYGKFAMGLLIKYKFAFRGEGALPECDGV